MEGEMENEGEEKRKEKRRSKRPKSSKAITEEKWEERCTYVVLSC